MSIIPQPAVSPYQPLNPEAARKILQTGEWDKTSALNLVIKDTNRAEQFATSRAFVAGWHMAQILYQSPYIEQYWEGTTIPKASVPMFTLADAINSLCPTILNGLFCEDPPFMVKQKPGTSWDTVQAIASVQGYQLEDIKFRDEISLGIANALLYGTAIWKYGWESFTRSRKVMKRVDNSIQIPSTIPGAPPTTIDPDEEEFETEDVIQHIDRPTFEHIANIRQVLVDPGLDRPNIQKAKYVIHRVYMTFEDLDKLRDRSGYDIPSRETVLSWFLPPVEEAEATSSDTAANVTAFDIKATPPHERTTEDPFEQQLEVLERWDKDKVIIVLQQKMVIGIDENPYGEIPFYSANWWNNPQSFWGMGLGKTIGSEQRLQQSLVNASLNQTSLALNGVYTRVRGKSVPTQQIRVSPGRVIDVDAKDDIGVLPRPPAAPEAFQHLQLSQQRAERTSGSNEASTGIGGSTAHSNLGRTAAGANLIASGSANRISEFVEKIAESVFVPFLDAMFEMNRTLLPPKTWKTILNDELGNAYLSGIGTVQDLFDARMKFSISAGAKLEAKRAMAQALPILMQFLSSPETTQHLSTQEKTVNIDGLLKMMFESSGWRNYYDIVIPMTPQQKQQMQAQSPAAVATVKAQTTQQGAAQLEQQKAASKAELADQNNIARGALEVLRNEFEKTATPEALTGEPGSQGFGSSL